MAHIILVIGTRPQIVKSAPVFRAAKSAGLEVSIVHTGQHYDYLMSKTFFDMFSLPKPTTNLKVGSGSHAWQTANIMIRLESVLMRNTPDLVIAPGDTNSTLATALTCAKLSIPVAHIESGARSYDLSMPEEINRRLTDHCSRLLFAPTKLCYLNLLAEGISRTRIHQTGDTMYDSFLANREKIRGSSIVSRLRLAGIDFAVITVHRQENVDDKDRLTRIIQAAERIHPLMLVFPAHPHVARRMREFGLSQRVSRMSHLMTIEPLPYFDMLALVSHSIATLTDSGGIQKEAFWLRVPCLTLRETTEWPETVQAGANFLVGTDPHKITRTLGTVRRRARIIGKRIAAARNPYGDGLASARIVSVLKATLRKIRR